MEHVLFTIGYATKTIDSFLACLKNNDINCVVDVRSSPFSKTFPDFNKPVISKTLKENNISYLHFGEEFGARRIEKEAYSTVFNLKGEKLEQVDFNKVYQLPKFQEGVERIIKGAKQNYRICFMCSEKHPIDCHRFWMVSYYFATLSIGFEIINIISETEYQSFREVLNSLDYDKEKEKFYRNHEELNQISLFEQPEIEEWVKYWDGIFNSNENPDNLKQKYANIRVGYSRGEHEND